MDAGSEPFAGSDAVGGALMLVFFAALGASADPAVAVRAGGPALAFIANSTRDASRVCVGSWKGRDEAAGVGGVDGVERVRGWAGDGCGDGERAGVGRGGAAGHRGGHRGLRRRYPHRVPSGERSEIVVLALSSIE